MINQYDATPRQWTPTNIPLPHHVDVIGIYELPFGNRREFLKTGMLSHVIGDWQVALTYDFRQGPFLTWGDDFYYGDSSTIGQTLTQGTKTLNQSFRSQHPSRRIPPMGRRHSRRASFPSTSPVCEPTD